MVLNMEKQVENVIVSNPDLIENNEFQELYRRLHDTSYSRDLTEVLMQAGINPTPYFTSIPPYCFYSSELLDNVQLNPECVKIAEYAFYKASVKNINLENIYEFGTKAFCGSKIEHVKIDTTCILSRHTFAECTMLKTVEFTNDATIIWGSFEKCTSLTDVHFGARCSLEVNAFAGCVNLQHINLENCIGLLDQALKQTAIEEVTIGPECKFIGSSVFSGCKNLKQITLLNKNVQLDAMSFWDNNKAVTVKCHKGSYAHEQLDKMSNPFIYVEFI